MQFSKSYAKSPFTEHNIECSCTMQKKKKEKYVSFKEASRVGQKPYIYALYSEMLFQSVLWSEVAPVATEMVSRSQSEPHSPPPREQHYTDNNEDKLWKKTY